MSQSLTQDDAGCIQPARGRAPDRLRLMQAENERLRELVQHCSAYWAYSHCGYQHMESSLRSLFDKVVGRTARSGRAIGNAGMLAAAQWRDCEHCGCRSNAAERVCCQAGRVADRRAWERSKG